MGQAKDYDCISERLKKRFVLGGDRWHSWRSKIQDIKVYLYSEFDRPATEDMGFFKLDDIQTYLNKAIKNNSKIKITAAPSGRFVKLSS